MTFESGALETVADDPITLPIHCPVCGQPVSLTYVVSEEFLEQDWTCPYTDCEQVHKIDLRGTVTTVVARLVPPAEWG